MKRKLSTREKVMIVLLVVATFVAYRLLSGEGIGFGEAAIGDGPELREFGEPPVVRMDLLGASPEGFDAAGRNLFAYYVPPPPPRRAPPPRKQNPRPAPPPREMPKPAPPPQPVAPTAPPPSFQYLGFLGPKDARIAVFDGGEGVRLARIGDVIDKEYRLLEFKHDSVELGYTAERWAGKKTELPMAGLR